MLSFDDGQCGVCKHYGDTTAEPQLVQIRTAKEAPADFTSTCGNPTFSAFELKVAPTSGCAGFEKVN